MESSNVTIVIPAYNEKMVIGDVIAGIQVLEGRKVLTEGEFELMSPPQRDDNIFVPKIGHKREVWRTIV